MTKEIKVGDTFSFTEEQLSRTGSVFSASHFVGGVTAHTQYIVTDCDDSWFQFVDDDGDSRTWHSSVFPFAEETPKYEWKVGDKFTINVEFATENNWYVDSGITDTTVLTVKEVDTICGTKTGAVVLYTDPNGFTDTIGFECIVPCESLEDDPPAQVQNSIKEDLEQFISTVNKSLNTEELQSVYECLLVSAEKIKAEIDNRPPVVQVTEEEMQNLLEVITKLHKAKGRIPLTPNSNNYFISLQISNCNEYIVEVDHCFSCFWSPFGIYFKDDESAYAAIEHIGKQNYANAVLTQSKLGF